MDYKALFGRSAEQVARDLIGRTIVRKLDEENYVSGMITQTGAYEGGKETKAREGMEYAPGTIFLMPFRGKYLFNIATGEEGVPSCVEIRQIQTEDKEITGSGRVTKELSALGLDGKVLGKELRISVGGVRPGFIKNIPGIAENCIGYFLLNLGDK